MSIDIEAAIAAYRAEVTAEAALAADDLDEIEDHFRALIDELREAGVPAGAIVAETRRRLGEPAAIAREHVRVRSSFGPALSRIRTWSAVVVMAPMVAWSMAGEPAAAEHILTVGLLVALVLRQAWARAALVGYSAFMAIANATFAVLWHDPTFALWAVTYAGVIAFVAPWRRHERSLAATALALQGWAYGAGVLMSGADTTAYQRTLLTASALAAVGAIVAGVGATFLARWGALVSIATAMALGVAAFALAGSRIGDDFARPAIVSLVASGALACSASAMLQWRNARSWGGATPTTAS